MTGCAPGIVLGVVTGLVTGTGELAGFVEGTVTVGLEGIANGVEAGLPGVTETGLVAGTVIKGGVGLSGGVMAGVVDIGVVGKIVVGGLKLSCKTAWRWDLLRSSLWEERKICPSSLLSSFCTKSSMDDTSAYNPITCPVNRVLFCKDFKTLSLN